MGTEYKNRVCSNRTFTRPKSDIDQMSEVKPPDPSLFPIWTRTGFETMATILKQEQRTMLLHKHGGGKERDKRQNRPFLRQCREVSIPLGNCRQFLDANLVRIAPSGALRNCFNLRYFTQEERGIGYSFQLAITAPLYSITGYCIATAHSCLLYCTISVQRKTRKIMLCEDDARGSLELLT